MSLPATAHATRAARAGFTLIEVTIGIAIGGFILFGMASAVFLVDGLYRDAIEEPFYEEHIHSIDTFLTYAFSEAGLPPAGEDGENADPEPGAESSGGDAGGGVVLRELPGSGFGEEPMISFQLPGDLPMLRPLDEDAPVLGRVTAYLVFDDDAGLLLYWHGEPEEEGEEPDVYQLALSPHVALLEYAYYDPEFEEWEIEQTLREEDDEYLLPDYLRINFLLYPDQQAYRTLDFLMPDEKAGVPLP
jgi:prepilin-type N-terminal cleavage/methylation domain-containing protein